MSEPVGERTKQAVPPEEQGGDPPCWAAQFAPDDEPDEAEPAESGG